MLYIASAQGGRGTCPARQEGSRRENVNISAEKETDILTDSINSITTLKNEQRDRERSRERACYARTP
jgi:hypothetical protein